jgi:hypothetical protein
MIPTEQAWIDFQKTAREEAAFPEDVLCSRIARAIFIAGFIAGACWATNQMHDQYENLTEAVKSHEIARKRLEEQ